MRGPVAAYFGFYPAADRYSAMSHQDFAAMIVGHWFISIGAILFVIASAGTHFAAKVWPSDNWSVVAALTGFTAGSLLANGAIQLWRSRHGLGVG